ncbi:MAG: DUF1553 domain-containing protein [Planctomycetaceae bacterium]
MLRIVSCFAVLSLFGLFTVGTNAADSGAESTPPVSFRWSFDGDNAATRLTSQTIGSEPLTAQSHGKVSLEVPGPRPSEYPDFPATNTAVKIPPGRNYLIVADSGEKSPLDFEQGDEITLESWLRWDEPLRGAYPYIIGKGRSHSGPGTTHNHNYSLRLANDKNGVFPSFLFADAESASQPKPGEGAWHRWTATDGIPEDGGWHHIAVTYKFGEPDSIKGYIDGRAVKGVWDAGGKTDKPPVVDNDQLWIGSSMGGATTFGGFLDDVALHRTALTPEQLKAKVRINIENFGDAVGKVDPATVPDDRVRVEVMEGVPVARSWKFRVREPQLLYETDLFALKDLPRKYNAKALITERKVPLLVHLATRLDLPAGDYEFLVRSLDAARLYVDGELRAETPFMDLRSDAHGPYYHLEDPGPGLLSVAAGHAENRVTVKLAAGQHQISLYRLIGNKGRSAYPGETCIGFGPVGGPYQFLSPTRALPFTDAGWLTFLKEDEARLQQWEFQLRQTTDRAEDQYWDQRHAYARKHAGPEIPVPPALQDDARPVGEIDRFINAKLAERKIDPKPLTDDFAFLRRVTLDLTGVIPTAKEIEAFLAAPAATRRAAAIERLINSPAWADHWVGYWQDVLAENPGLTKPELNNSGPFRWYLYEAFCDGKPMDRFVTELLMMEGSALEGGPAGFSIASQNDVPMAAKAHVVGTAFLGVEMKCARCHDAPNHDLTQRDLFSLAAMLKREEQPIPQTSSIPATPEQLARMQVRVTLKPGEKIKPDWPFVEFVSLESDDGKSTTSTTPFILPPELMREPNDTRASLAAQITSPYNTRFAKVVANRLWKRYLGQGFIEPVDDWEGATCEYPELLDWLARELVTHDYDLKHVARLILNSEAYQRQSVGPEDSREAMDLIAGPRRRKLTGEQLADSLYHLAGKDYGSEELTMDRDGKQSMRNFLHLRYPHRAWQFVAVANERDRPSLNLPAAQTVIDLMAAYGWRQQRQDPLTDREDTLTPLQPMALAHGSAAAKSLDLSDDSALTAFALQDQPVEQLVEQLFLQILSRPSTSTEREALVGLLSPGYAQRIVAGPEAVPPTRIFRSGVTWANHFAPKSDEEAIARQRQILEGDPPSVRLNSDWRERAEDAVWALVNLPEFIFVP